MQNLWSSCLILIWCTLLFSQSKYIIDVCCYFGRSGPLNDIGHTSRITVPTKADDKSWLTNNSWTQFTNKVKLNKNELGDKFSQWNRANWLELKVKLVIIDLTLTLVVNQTPVSSHILLADQILEDVRMSKVTLTEYSRQGLRENEISVLHTLISSCHRNIHDSHVALLWCHN